MRRRLIIAVLAPLAIAPWSPGRVAAQAIRFESELPRTLVFIPEEGGAGTASREVTGFLLEAGFPLVDPALAHTAAQRELVRAALAGDEGAAVQLGRDFGAHVLVLGSADWGTRPDPVTGTLVTGTGEVSLRALRLDDGRVVATSRSTGRKLEATDQAARSGALREAVTALVRTTDFMGAVVNDWEERGWSGRGYFRPDPGSVEASLTGPAGPGPRVAILDTRVAPPVDGGSATRGLGVVRKSERGRALANPIEVEGVVIGADVAVEVEGEPARLERMTAAEAQRLGITAGPASRFVARTVLPGTHDSVRVVARDGEGRSTTVLAAPRIDRRFAVIVGIGEYRDARIADLDYAARDARAMYDFLRSDAAGPFAEEDILLLTDEQATAQALREALFVFLQQADWDDLVVIYFAGHGAPDPGRPDNLYLLPADADVSALAATGFPMWDVKTALRRQISAERVIVLADACHSAGTSAGAEGNPIGAAFGDLFTPSRRLTLTAADVNELSFEDAKWGGGHGIFTHFILEGLRGAADGDDDGIVTFVEVAGFVKERVAGQTGGAQNPQFSGLGDVPLAVVGNP